jgi:hypothetical protein
MVDPTTLAQIYRNKAARCRRLAQQTTDREIAERLSELAREFEEHAAQAEKPEE